MKYADFVNFIKNEFKAVGGLFDEKSKTEKNKSSTPEWDKVIKLASMALNNMLSDKNQPNKTNKTDRTDETKGD